MMKKETEDDTERWKETWCFEIRRLNTVTRTILSKAIYNSKPVPVKILKAFLHRNRIILKHVWSQKRPQITKATLRKKNTVAPVFKIYGKATVIKTVWHWPKKRYRDQLNRLEHPQINPHSYVT